MTPDELTKILRNNPDIVLIDDGAPSRPAPIAAKLPTPTEHDEQVALFKWAAANEAKHPELALLHATPMGGHRHPAVGAMLKMEGCKAGYPDVSLPVARGRWHSIHIELKRADHSNRPTSEQLLWIEKLREYRNFVCVCYGAQDAINTIMSYLTQEDGL